MNRRQTERRAVTLANSFPDTHSFVHRKRAMSGEEYLARKYCEPNPYWHCLRELAGSYYSLKELNYPEYWLDAVAKYIGAKPSAAARQLHRTVEAGRAEVKAKQDRIYGNRKVSQTEGVEETYRKEDKALDVFNAHKQDCLQAYVKAIETGRIETQRARRRHRCGGEGCRELLSGKARFCDICKRARNREAARVYRGRNQPCSVISSTREITLKNGAFGYRDTPYRRSCGARQGKERLIQAIGQIKMPQPGSAINAGAREAGISFGGIQCHPQPST
jgi:hypothetical protein